MFILVKLYSACSTSALDFIDHIGFAQNSCFVDFKFLFLFIVSMEKSIALMNYVIPNFNPFPITGMITTSIP